MTVKSNFNLDKRINNIDDIQTIICNNRGFIGCKGFVFDNFVQAKDLTKCKYVTLVDIDDNDGGNDQCFKVRDKNGNNFVGYYRFSIPEEALKPVEKKYRAFTGIEFAEKFDCMLGKVIRLREKRPEYSLTEYEYKTVFTGYRWCGDVFEVFLNSNWINLSTLLEKYEHYENSEWCKFGVEVEE